jgi:hypothetical protein
MEFSWYQYLKRHAIAIFIINVSGSEIDLVLIRPDTRIYTLCFEMILTKKYLSYSSFIYPEVATCLLKKAPGDGYKLNKKKKCHPGTLKCVVKPDHFSGLVSYLPVSCK